MNNYMKVDVGQMERLRGIMIDPEFRPAEVNLIMA